MFPCIKNGSNSQKTCYTCSINQNLYIYCLFVQNYCLTRNFLAENVYTKIITTNIIDNLVNK